MQMILLFLLNEGSQLNLLSMTIPRHLVDLTTLMTTLLIVSACIGPMNTDLCNNIASHFTGCKVVEKVKQNVIGFLSRPTRLL